MEERHYKVLGLGILQYPGWSKKRSHVSPFPLFSTDVSSPTERRHTIRPRTTTSTHTSRCSVRSIYIWALSMSVSRIVLLILVGVEVRLQVTLALGRANVS